MTEYPDGLLLELRMNAPTRDGSLQRVRLPMFVDTAQLIIAELKERLKRIAQSGSPPNKQRLS
jgi:hypothetical protein